MPLLAQPIADYYCSMEGKFDAVLVIYNRSEELESLFH
jgi:hypothetical protein